MNEPGFHWNNHITTAILFICVTLSAWVFKSQSILYWYALGACLEVLYILPGDSWRTKNNTYDHTYSRNYDKDESKYKKSNFYSDNR